LRHYKGLLQVAFTPNPQYNMHIFEAGVTYGFEKTK